MTTRQTEWVIACLLNDETSTDRDLFWEFTADGIDPDEAQFYIDQRNDALIEGLSFKLIPYERP
jgi:hypothetical protein